MNLEKFIVCTTLFHFSFKPTWKAASAKVELWYGKHNISKHVSVVNDFVYLVLSVQYTELTQKE